MAKIVRYDGNLKAFASEQLTNERTLFGQVTIANDLTSQITAQFLRGWGIVGPSDQPSLQDFNAAMYTNGQLLAYLHQMGIAEYNAAQEYFTGGFTQTGGVLYMSLTDANIGNTPSSSPANWKAYTADQATEVALGLVKIATQAQTNAGTDDATAVTPKKLAAATQGQKHTAFSTTGTATAQVITPVPAIAAYAAGLRVNATFNVASGANPTINFSGLGAKNLKQYDSSGAKVAAVFYAGMNSDLVYDGTDVVLLDPIASIGQATEVVNGSVKIATQAIVNALLNDLTTVTPLKLGSGFATVKAVNGYLKLPEWMGSLIIQWGWANVGDDAILAVTLPIAFPSTFCSAIATAQTSTASTATGTWSGTAFRTSNSVITVGANSSSGTGITAAGVCWVAIGY